MKKKEESIPYSINKVDITSLDKWVYDKSKSIIIHESGGFFKLQGLRVNASTKNNMKWDQPIINQNEIGYLGFITRKINGVVHFLTQAKIEPGNINGLQLSPTLQATRSNYLGLHRGKKPLYLEYFTQANQNNIVIDTLQSEVGCRFLRKRNRNIIIEVNEEIKVEDNFKWMTLKQLKELMNLDNLVNMDTRSVLSNIRFSVNPKANDLKLSNDYILDSILGNGKSKYSIDQINNFITYYRCKYSLNVHTIRLDEMKEWEFTNKEIIRTDKKHFKIIGIESVISNREKTCWQQPILETFGTGICSLIGKKINNVFHVIVQAKLECGNRDIIELAPTVQLLSGIDTATDIKKIDFLEYIISSNKKQVISNSKQSDEGGRFYHVQNKYTLILADNSFNETLPEGYIWITLNQLLWLNRFDGYVNNYLRNFLAMLKV